MQSPAVPTRRSITRSVAWSVPVIAATAAAPAMAFSEELFCGSNEYPGMVGFEFVVTNTDSSVALLGVGGCVTGGGLDWNIYPYLDWLNPPSVAPGTTSVVRLFTYAPVGALPGSSFTVDVVLHTMQDGIPGTIVQSVVIPVPIPYQCVWFPEEPLIGGPWDLGRASSVSGGTWMGEICP